MEMKMEFKVSHDNGWYLILTNGIRPRNKEKRKVIDKYTMSRFKQNELLRYDSKAAAEEAVEAMLKELACN